MLTEPEQVRGILIINAERPSINVASTFDTVSRDHQLCLENARAPGAKTVHRRVRPLAVEYDQQAERALG